MNKTITLHIYLTELMFDIEKSAWQIGRSRKDSQQLSHAEEVQDIDDERILRFIQTSYKDVTIALSEMIAEGTTTADNILLPAKRKSVSGGQSITLTWGRGETTEEEDNVLTIVLRAPSNFATSQSTSLANAIHSYIINYSLSEWLLLTNPSEAANYKQLAAESLQQLYAASFARVQPRRAHAPQKKEPQTNNEIRYE